MGLGEFLFGNRRKYNGEVMQLLKAMDIETDSSIDPRFPGPIGAAQEIDIGWANKYSAPQCALMFAIDYYVGLHKNNLYRSRDEAEALALRILSAIQETPREYISAECAKQYENYLFENRNKYIGV